MFEYNRKIEYTLNFSEIFNLGQRSPGFQHSSQIYPGIRCFAGRYFLGGASAHNSAAPVAALGAEVYDIVGALYHIKIVLYHKHGIAGVGLAPEYLKQFFHVVGLQAGCRLIEQVYGFAGAPARQLVASFTRCASPPESVVAG